jgi:hypothetical protein
MHTDASDVTFNVCLGKEFTGVSSTSKFVCVCVCARVRARKLPTDTVSYRNAGDALILWSEGGDRSP